MWDPGLKERLVKEHRKFHVSTQQRQFETYPDSPLIIIRYKASLETSVDFGTDPQIGSVIDRVVLVVALCSRTLVLKHVNVSYTFVSKDCQGRAGDKAV